MGPSIIISLVALGISALTAWLTWFHRGTIKMTRPAIVFFGPDDTGRSKVFLRTLLYSTSRRGQLVETMYVKLKRGEFTQLFNIWVYGETKALARGSGLFVGYEGVASNHHYMLPKGAPEFHFLAGSYTIEVFAKLVNSAKDIRLLKLDLAVDEAEGIVLIDGQAGLYFDWNPESKGYDHALDNRFAGDKLSKAFAASVKLSNGEELT